MVLKSIPILVVIPSISQSEMAACYRVSSVCCLVCQLANVQYLPRDQFDDDVKLEIGLIFSFADAGGDELPGMIISFDNNEVTVDFNHPLSGRTILFDVLIHRVEPAELH